MSPGGTRMGIDDQDAFEVLRRRPTPMPAVTPQDDVQPEDGASSEAAEAASDDEFAERATLRLQIVDDASNRPVPGVVLLVMRADGREAQLVSDATGLVVYEDEFADTTTLLGSFAGRHHGSTWCPVALEAGEPSDLEPVEVEGTLALADVQVHKVTKGDSLESLATPVGLTWQQLAEFNWGTSLPARIHEHMRDDVGCTRFADDGVSLVFDDGDDPGLVRVPRTWRLADVPLDRPSRLRISPEPPARCMTISFLVSAEAGLADAYPRYVLESADGRYAEERTARDDLVPGDHFLQLVFDELPLDTTYTLTRWHDAETSEVLFRDAPGPSIVDQSRPGARGLIEGAFTGLVGLVSLGELAMDATGGDGETRA